MLMNVSIRLNTTTEPRCRDYLMLDRRIRVFYVVLVCIVIGIVCPALISYYLGDYRADLGNCATPARYRCIR